MESQHQKIKGYRDLSQEEIDLMNEIKAKGVELGSLVDKLFDHARSQIEKAGAHGDSTGDYSESERILAAEPAHWVATGATQLQQGLMALTRAVAQPTTF
uniref:Acb2/Tad1 domain-containing protein n=1 Tax=uncultured Acinetobacter sp. TaxID=165433 RepID=UPI00263516DE|nr:hypothetical protein [uncultured Acinetobacter sp.]